MQPFMVGKTLGKFYFCKYTWKWWKLIEECKTRVLLYLCKGSHSAKNSTWRDNAYNSFNAWHLQIKAAGYEESLKSNQFSNRFYYGCQKSNDAG